MNNLFEEIDNLSGENLIEAATFVANEISLGEKSDDELIALLESSPMKYLQDVKSLSKIILYNTADLPEYKETVIAAINNTGKRNLILGGTEIVALAAIGLAALRIILNPKNSDVITYYDQNGHKVTRKTTYNNHTSFLGQIFNLFKK